MHAVILAGGKGTRLRPFTMTIPKPLLPLGDIPVLEIVIEQLAHAGFSRISITLNHMAPLFSALLGDGSKWGVRLDYHIEDEPLGTAGSLRLIPDLPEQFLVMNGDLLTTLRYADVMQANRKAKSWATIAVNKRQVNIDYGVIESDERGRLLRYKEKPVLSYDVSMGIYILTRRALDLLPPTGRFDMPELMLKLHAAGHPVHCHQSTSYWQDIGRLDDYQKASEDFLKDPRCFLPDRGAREPISAKPSAGRRGRRKAEG